MKLDRLFSTAGAVLMASAFSGCGAQDAKPAAGADAPASEEAPAQDASTDAAPDAPPADPGLKPVTVADIDRWSQGMAAELEAVHAAAAKLKQAKTADDTSNAMAGMLDTQTLGAGAQAAGVDGERYNLIRSTFSTAAGYLAPSIGGLDTTNLSPEQRADMRRDNAAQLDQMKDVLPPDVVSALTPRAAELRTKDLELTAARLKAAGAGAP
jgi:hypothetical protein